MLELDLGGTEFRLEIKRYHPGTHEKWDCEWCQVYVSVHNSCINYERNTESLLCCEVEKIHQGVTALLSGKSTEKCELSFIEPDFELFMVPDDEGKPYMNWQFNLWNKGVLTANSFTLVMDVEEIKKSKDYLESIMK